MTSLVATNLAIPGRLLDTDLAVAAGQMVALVGPNGGGKTSLLRALARVEQARGQVIIDDEDVDALGEVRRRSLLALVPASRDVGWPIAARDVIALGLELRDGERVEELVTLLELEPFADRPVNQLSTGERARVLLARALAAKPRLLLLDEPFANLEPYWVLRLFEILRNRAQRGAIVLVALHDLSQLGGFDRALLIAGGRVVIDGPPDRLTASEQFEQIFRLRQADGRWMIRR